ncbi:hypothetical protein CKM354_000908700 [Cercospora kikuchii]|uniref:Uncharacterized protein n=1 Tax=Cercospora kikuchii TaxID=84275 RepID=A0A9P3CNN6_9PEZI|nr:uncharacterized protein CKM354_000908700 [Cercospora kikuchii]GIZ45941.1 hypothetical protein CKM354_000908700 [Cercospora kikuchii]
MPFSLFVYTQYHNFLYTLQHSGLDVEMVSLITATLDPMEIAILVLTFLADPGLRCLSLVAMSLLSSGRKHVGSGERQYERSCVGQVAPAIRIDPSSSNTTGVAAFRQHRSVNLRLVSGDPMMKIIIAVPGFYGHTLLIVDKARCVPDWNDGTVLYANEQQDEDFSSKILRSEHDRAPKARGSFTMRAEKYSIILALSIGSERTLLCWMIERIESRELSSEIGMKTTNKTEKPSRDHNTAIVSNNPDGRS